VNNDQQQGYADLKAGDELRGRLTVTEAHVVLASGVFGDFASVYIDEQYAAGSRHGTRVAPGTLVAGVMVGVLGKALSGSMLGLVEQSFQFLTPVIPGDTVTTEWVVGEKEEDPRGGGIVRLSVRCMTQAGDLAATGSAAILLAGSA
jgi:3-hydroxybutyryl-CoA dehydratase